MFTPRNTPSRRRFLQAGTGTALAASAGAITSHAFGQENVSAAAQRPNVLFVLTDQWRASAFGSGTDEVVRTPHLDAFAAQGVRCSRAYAGNPVCTPNRSCILTGRHSHQTGMITNNLMLPPSEVCFPERFRDAGYATHYIGKWHMDGSEKPGFVPPGWRRRGFNTFEGFNRGHSYHEHWGFDNEGQALPWESGGDPYYEPAMQADLAMRFIKSHQAKQTGQPFLCYVSWGPPHTPFRPPKRFDLYTEAGIQFRPNVPEAHQKQAAKDLAGYYGLCESLDHEMGRLLQFLDDNGLSENTLVVFTADHGEMAGSHGKYRKSEPEDESLNVPLFMRLPGRLKSGVTEETLFSSLDLMPTMLSVCGLDDPGTCTGRDLSGALVEGGTAPTVDSVYSEGKVGDGNAQEWRCLVTPTHKLTIRRNAKNEDLVESLIDLKNDPFEMENLAGKRPKLQQKLLAELKAHAEATGDVFPKASTPAKAMYSGAEAEKAKA